MRLELLEDRALLAQIPVFSVLDDGSAGTLRSAIVQANTMAGADEIVFDSLVFGTAQTIILTSGQLTITDDLTITGTGAGQLAISGNQLTRVFEIVVGVDASLSGLTIRDGVNLNERGGGGIFNAGILTVSNSTIASNSAIREGVTAFRPFGGGILSTGILTVSNSSISNNSARRIEDGIISGIEGGGIYSKGILIVNNSSISNNFASSGGGLLSYSDRLNSSTLSISDSAITNNTGGGILCLGTSSISNSTIANNTTPAFGGGIANAGALTISYSTITNNTSSSSGGGILNGGSLMIDHSQITNNAASGHGGGIYQTRGGSNVSNSTIAFNSAGLDGGGVYGSASISNSTISNNTANRDGGGFYGAGASITYGGGNFSNSTFANNSAGNQGGGMHLAFGLLSNLTVTANRSNTNGSTGGGGGIYIPNNTQTPTLFNSIVAGNFNGPDPSSTADDVSGTLNSRSAYNLTGVGGSGGLQDRSVNPITNNQVGVANPGLGQLGNNGGSTKTVPLLVGSPAIAGGSRALAGGTRATPGQTETGYFDGSALVTDQRGTGFPRFYNSTIDIGAFESQFAPSRTTFTVINNADSGPGSLRQAIQNNNLSGGGNTIDFTLSPAETITLTSGELQVIQDVNIVGPGPDQLAVSGNHASRVFGVYGNYYVFLDVAASTISGLTIKNGITDRSYTPNGSGGGIYVELSTLTVSHCVFSGNSSRDGGAISNSGILLVEDSRFVSNAADGGGAIANGGSLVVTGSVFYNNTSVTGGGIANSGNLTVSSSTFDKNSAMYGGGISNYGFTSQAVSISDSTFSNNTSTGNGGGIWFSSDYSLNVVNSSFSGNASGGSGGGIYFEYGAVHLNNVTIANNSANEGGGIYNIGYGVVQARNSIIAKNEAPSEPDVYGRIGSDGHNIVGFVSDVYSHIFIPDGVVGDIWSEDPLNPIDPLLGPLGAYGGPTRTMPLLPGSPALNAGGNILAVNVLGAPLTTDQRGIGYDRIVNGTVDIGAFESQNQSSNVVVAISAPLDGFQGVSGQMRSFALTATDPSLAPAVVLAYVVDWGDGSPLEAYPASLSLANAQHAFPTAGSYIMSVRAMDAAGDASVATTRTIAILSTESQGPVFAVGGTSAEDVSADDTLTLTPVTATTATLKRNTTNLGSFNQSVYPNGVKFYGGSGNDTVVFKGTTADDLFTTTENSVAWNTIVLQGQDVEQWSINALAGNDTITIVSGTPSVDGGAGTDKIIAADVANLWTISSANAGTLNDQAFSRVENLTGGTDGDVFQYVGTGSLGGTIDGGLGLGNNVLDYSKRSTKVNVNLLNSTSSGTGGIANLQYFVGSQASDDTLTAPATPNTWTIFDASIGELSSLNGLPSLYGFNDFESLAGGSADDTFLMQPAGSIGTLNGGGGPGIDRLELQDRGTSLDVSVSTTGRSVQGVVGNFSALEQVESLGASSDRLLGGIANTSWSVNALGQVVVSAVTYIGFDEIAGGSGVDTLTGPASETAWNIAGYNSGQVSASGLNYAFTGIENLTGGVAEDIFVFQPSGVVSGNVNGGTGIGNTISYAAWTLGVGVNLNYPTSAVPNGNATAVLGALKNISIVMGGAGNDIFIGNPSAPTVLVGNAGNDILTGVAGRDILIGGIGADTLSGAGGQDILIGGSTAHDTSHTALLKIQLEWRNTTRTFAQRVNNLRGIGVDPRSNGSYFLNTDTVFADLETDSLMGGNGKDWFWGDPSEILDFVSSGSLSDILN